MSFIQLGKLEVDLNELRAFIVKAKKHCYAGEGEETRLADGSKQLTFQEGNFHYTDNYDGYCQAPGSEIIRWKRPNGKRIWQMSYSGGMLLGQWDSFAGETFEFLKEALGNIEIENPFRGPESKPFVNGNWRYEASTDSRDCRFSDNITRFSGKEKIILSGHPVFSQDYIGELVIPKQK